MGCSPADSSSGDGRGRPEPAPATGEREGVAVALAEPAREAEGIAGPAGRRPDEGVNTYPHLVFFELLCALLVIAAFTVLSVLVNAPLEGPANPAETPNPAKAPWYFVGLQELLVYFDPWIGGVMIPLLIILGLLAVPYLDVNRDGNSTYAFRSRPFAVTVFSAGLALWFGMILIGYYLRGPSWQLYWPWESWEILKPLKDVTWSLEPGWGGLALLAGYALAGYGLPFLVAPAFRRRLGRLRYAMVMSLLLLMGGVAVKIGLRLLWNIKYVLVTPWFNL